jgi:hypothetical protein
MFGDLNNEQIEQMLRTQEQVYNQIRQSGEEAPAKILSVTDTGVRIGENASMLRFNMEVFPEHRASFRADTQNAISDASRPKFTPGSTIYVKFDPNDTTQVAIDHAPIQTPKNTFKCSACGAAQTLSETQSACSYCGSPLAG